MFVHFNTQLPSRPCIFTLHPFHSRSHSYCFTSCLLRQTSFSGKLRSSGFGADSKQRRLKRDLLRCSAALWTLGGNRADVSGSQMCQSLQRIRTLSRWGDSQPSAKRRDICPPYDFFLSFFRYAGCFHSPAPGYSRPSSISSPLLHSHSLIPLHTSINRALQSAHSHTVLNTAFVQLQWAATDLNH